MKPDLDELRRLLAEATPGPWNSYAVYSSLRHADKHDVLSDETCAAMEKMGEWLPTTEHDGDLIVAMRNALPALLAEADAGRKLREAMNDAESWGDAQRAAAEYDAAVAKGGAE